ncbi:MAG: iron chaperone [Candidatus Dormibacteria bacterium]
MATKSAAKRAATTESSGKFTAEERAAMRERAKELKAEALKLDGEKEVLAKIAAMSEPDRSVGKRLHAVIKATDPQLSSRTWYGMPAYTKDGDIVCFFKPAEKFNARYATLGFTDKANLDDGAMWPTEFALKKLTPAEEKKIAALVKKAVS